MIWLSCVTLFWQERINHQAFTSSFVLSHQQHICNLFPAIKDSFWSFQIHYNKTNNEVHWSSLISTMSINQLHIAITFYGISATLNFFGLFFLKRFKPNTTCSSIQRLCLLNLCFVGLLFSIMGCCLRVLLLTRHPYLYHVIIWQAGFLNCWYISVMILLTFDRFMAVHLNIRYHLYWSFKKMSVALFTVFIISVFISVVLMFYPASWKTKFRLISGYIWPTYDILFLFVAVLTYAYLYYKLKRIRRKETQLKKELNSNNTVENTFQETKKSFYLPTFIILSFFCFYAIPDMTFSVEFWTGMMLPKELKFTLSMMFPIGMTINAIIYIVFPAKNYGHSQLRNLCCCGFF